MKNHKICIFNVLSDILHATYNLRCYLKKQSQSFDKLRTRLPASGRKHEILNPKPMDSEEKNWKQTQFQIG